MLKTFKTPGLFSPLQKEFDTAIFNVVYYCSYNNPAKLMTGGIHPKLKSLKNKRNVKLAQI